MLMISQEIPCFSNSSAAKRDSQTKCPVATMVTSVPSCNKIPFPISKGISSGIKTGTTGLPNLK